MSNQIHFQCRQCKRLLAVRAELAGKKVRCPGCQSIQLVDAAAMAAQPALARAESVAVRDQSAAPAPIPFDWPESPAPAAAPGQSRYQVKKQSTAVGGSASKVLLAKRYWMLIAIVVLNICLLFVALIQGKGLVLFAIVELAAGAVLSAMLFLPRLYLVKKVAGVMRRSMGVMAKAVAGAGVLMTALLVLKAGLRLTRKLDNADSAGKIDLGVLNNQESLTFLFLAIVTHVGVIATVILLWHWLGLVRTMVSTYLLQLLIIVCMFISLDFTHGDFGTHRQVDDFSSPEGRWPDARPPNLESHGPSGAHPYFPGARSTPVNRANPFNLPADEVVLIVLQHRIVPDEAKIQRIQAALTDAFEPSDWETKQDPGAWLLTLKFNGTIEDLKALVEKKNVTRTQFVNERQRVLILRPI